MKNEKAVFINVNEPFTMLFDDVKVIRVTKKFVKVLFHGWEIYIYTRNFNKLCDLGALFYCTCITSEYKGEMYRWLQIPSVF